MSVGYTDEKGNKWAFNLSPRLRATERWRCQCSCKDLTGADKHQNRSELKSFVGDLLEQARDFVLNTESAQAIVRLETKNKEVIIELPFEKAPPQGRRPIPERHLVAMHPTQPFVRVSWKLAGTRAFSFLASCHPVFMIQWCFNLSPNCRADIDAMIPIIGTALNYHRTGRGVVNGQISFQGIVSND